MTEMNVVLEAVVGSKAYGLDTPESDEDRLGVFVAPTEEILGLDWNTLHRATVEQHNPDTVHHEIGKFCRLALACNPTLTELLWIDDPVVMAPAGILLRVYRADFLSTRLVRAAYGGYARQQVQRLLRRQGTFSSATANRTAKHARHCVRLLWQGYELLTTGDLTVRLTEDQARTCREMGELAAAEPTEFERVFAKLDSELAEAESVLPDEPDRAAINRLLVNVRRDYWGKP